MKLDQLHYFVETAKRQHLGQAAHFLHISPSAISHSIAALEKELGRSLFIKQGRQIKLTTHGKLLLEKADYILTEIDRLREEMSSDEVKMRGHYKIAATHFLCAEFLTPSWIELQHLHPGLTATFYSLRSGEVLSKVNASEVDLGFCFCPHSGPNHMQELIHQGKLVFAFGKKHPFLTSRRKKTISDYPAILAQASVGIANCESHPSFQKLNIKPKVINYYDSYDVAIRALKYNAVWTLLPDFLAYSHSTDIEIYLPRGWQADYTIEAIWPRYHLRTHALDCLINKMKHTIKSAIPKNTQYAINHDTNIE